MRGDGGIGVEPGIAAHRDIALTEGYAADWTVAQLRKPAQRIADRIETLMRSPVSSLDADV